MIMFDKKSVIEIRVALLDGYFVIRGVHDKGRKGLSYISYFFI